MSRYERIMTWARERYTVDGRLIYAIGKHLTVYARIEELAFNRYILKGIDK
jgi:hypothetical protein